jgi:hypothetical protein
MSATNEFVQKLLAQIGTGKVNHDAVAKLVNGLVKSLDKEKKEEKKANKESKNKGKDKPKSDKPHNPYILYCIAKRQSIVDAPENKGKPPKEITAILADEWRKERDQNTQFVKDLQQQAEAESLKYKLEKEEKKKSIAEKSGDESESENEESSKKKKREPSAYNVFYSQTMAQLKEEGVDVAEIPKAITEKWKNLSAEEKKSFKGKALSPKKTKKAEIQGAPIKAKKTVKKAEEEEKAECARALDFSDKEEKKVDAVKEKEKKKKSVKQ